jgi:hypothetical protein
MSRLREQDIQASVHELQQMFPQHSAHLIEAVLKSKKGVIDAAVSVLLDTAADCKEARPMEGPPSSTPPLGRASAALRVSKHVFPPDFLRWPPDAPVICEDLDGHEIPIPSFGGGQPRQLEPAAPMPPLDRPVFRVHQDSRDEGSKPLKGWAKFKAKFMGKKKTHEEYSHLLP